MSKQKFTDAAISRLKPPANGQASYWDALMPGFGILVSKTTRTWQLNTRILKEGVWKQTRVTLGRYPEIGLADARDRARLAEQAAKAGNDPRGISAKDRAAKVEASRDTLSVVAQDFLSKYVDAQGRRAATKTAYKAALFGKDVADWQSRPVSAISRRDIRDRLAEVAADRPTQANRYLAYWRRFFRWCLEHERVFTDPTAGVTKPSAEHSRERALSLDEIGEVLASFNQSSVTHRMLHLLFLTGQRLREISALRWDEVHDLDGTDPRIELPSDRTKNDRPHIVPLSKQAVTLIKKTHHIKDCEFVFSTNGKTSVSGFSKAKKDIDRTIAETRKKLQAKPMPAWTIHDLRRTCATRLHEDLKIEPHVVEAILNHVSGTKAGVAGVYNRAAYLEQRREALQAWANKLDEIASKTASTKRGK